MAQATASKAGRTAQTKIKQGLAGFVWRVNRQLQWFQGDQDQAKAAPKRRCPCLVVARGLYSESWQHYNIRSQRALQKVLKTKYANSARHQFFIGPWRNGQRKVLLIELSTAAQALREKAYVLLPESLVLSAALSDGLYEINDGEQHYFLFKQGEQWQTLLRSSLVNNLEKARLALGCTASQTAAQLTQQQLASLTPRGVNKLGLSYWQQGMQQRQAASSGLPWQKLAITTAAIGGLYLAISSGYLLLQKQLISAELEEISPQVSTLLDQQQQLQRAQRGIDELSGQFVNAQRINAFWLVLQAAREHPANRITYLQSNDDTLVLGGVADEALPLLRQLHGLPQVQSAEFASALRNSRLGQQYRINMVLAAKNEEPQP